jgi:hypothetical protein
MALIKCNECSSAVSDSAEKCPHCGAKVPKRTSRFAIAIAGLFAIGIAMSIFRGGGSSSSTPPSPKSPAELKTDQELNTAVSAGLVLKNRAKDPASFKVETFFVLPGGAACYEYRAKNSFNAVVPARAVFVPPATMVTSETDKGRFTKTWNATCTKPGQEYGGSLFN